MTTNANLTGPITSVGNATSIASKTGTGTTFAMQSSPTLTGSVTIPGTGIWSSSGNVGIGTNAPSDSLHIYRTGGNAIRVDSNSGDLWSFYNYGATTKTAVGYRDATAALSFYVNGTDRMVVKESGNVGIGTTSPEARLEILSTDPQLRVRNSNGPTGAFIGDTWSTLYLGIYNTSSTASGAIPANGVRSILGMDNTGKIGSVTNTSWVTAPEFRNVLDDGNGNVGIGTTTPDTNWT